MIHSLSFGHQCCISRPYLFMGVCDRIHLDPQGPWCGSNVPSSSFPLKSRELQKPCTWEPLIGT